MNWFKRHLNWALVFGYVASGAIAPFIIQFILGIVLTFQHVSPDMQSTIGTSAGAIAGIILTVLVTIWFLGQKSRSNWHLLWLICPFGVIVLLCLKNKSGASTVISPGASTAPIA